jgi:uncharacterized protein (TIGR03083 family)
MQTETQRQHDLDTVVAAIRQELEVLDRYLAALQPQGWSGPTACTEWTVQKTVSHLGSGAQLNLGTLRTNLDGAEPIGDEARRGVWDHFDSLAPEPLHAEFRGRTREYLDYLANLPADKRGGRVQSFAGETSIAEFAQFRLFELSLHSWDIRVALDPTARLLPLSARTNFPHALGMLNRRANKAAKAEMTGAAYRFEVFGPVTERFAIVVRDGNVEVADAPHENVLATVRLPAEAFIRLYTGRLPLERAEADGEVSIEGDRAAALRLNTLFPGF